MYYGLILTAVLMFGVQFLENGRYRESAGETLRATMLFCMLGAAAGLPILLAAGGFSLRATPMTLLLAFATALNGMLFNFCGIRALGRINLSLYSVFSMLGGMLLPFCAGILFFDEGMSWAKAICLVFIVLGVGTTFRRGGEHRGGFLLYLGIFVFNGMAGVLSMLFRYSPYPVASAADYSVFSAVFRVLLSALTLLILLPVKKKPRETFSFRAGGQAALVGVIGTAANYLLLIALSHVPGTMQYPLVTGGVMIVSTLLGYLTKRKPTRRDWISVTLSFLGMAALLLPV